MVGKDATVFYTPEVPVNIRDVYTYRIKPFPKKKRTEEYFGEDRGFIYETEGAIILKKSQEGSIYTEDNITGIPKFRVIKWFVWPNSPRNKRGMEE